MNWTMVGALGELFGALAVVASLLYVGNQVHQNNRIARAEAYRDVTRPEGTSPGTQAL